MRPAVPSAELRDALLALALQEGLLEVDDRATDGVFRPLREFKVPERVSALLRENLLISRSFVLPVGMHDAFRGDAIDRGALRLVPRSEGGSPDEFFSWDVLLSALLLRGRRYTPATIVDRLRRAAESVAVLEKLGLIEQLGLGTTLDGDLGVDVVRRAVDPDFPPMPGLHRKAVLEYREASSESAPIVSAVEDIRQTVAAAHAGGARALLPAGLAPASPVETEVAPTQLAAPPDLTCTGQEFQLYRFVMTSLRRVPIGATLSDTIAVRDTPAGRAFSEQFDRWTSIIQTGSPEPWAEIAREIEQARAAIKDATALPGRLATYGSVPVNAAGLVFPPAGVAGFVQSLHGAGKLFTAERTLATYSWATIGD